MVIFSIIMPVYNGSTFLEEAIRSVLDQTLREFELIIVDDGSTDSTREISERFSKMDNRVSYYHKDHSGLAETLNFGLQKSSGEYIARIDADDTWDLGKLRIQYASLRDNPNVGLIGSSVNFIDEKGELIPDLKGFNNGIELQPNDLIKQILRNNVICSSTQVFRRNLIDHIGIYNITLSTSMDYDLTIRALFQTEGLVLKDPLVQYRISRGMMTLRKRNVMIRESVKIRLSVLKLYKPSIYLHLCILKDIISLCAEGFYYRLTGRSKLSHYLISQ